ncbi:MAG: hypothetical protein ACK40X_00585, partial [Armatimonadota bacterium]
LRKKFSGTKQGSCQSRCLQILSNVVAVEIVSNEFQIKCRRKFPHLRRLQVDNPYLRRRGIDKL